MSVRGGRCHRLQGAVLGERRDVRGDGAGAKRGDHGERGVERRKARDAGFDGSAADEEAVATDGFPGRWRVADRRTFARADELQDVLASLRELTHLSHVDAERTDQSGGAGGRDQVVPEPGKTI